LLALKEAYPDLKSNENFLALQTELSETEDKIEMARRFYNGATRELNVAVSTVPNNLIAGPLGFHEVEYFEIETADRTVPTVDLDV
jgi:LemA protein